MNFAEWSTVIFLPLAVISDLSQLSNASVQANSCETLKVVEVKQVKVVSDIQSFEDLPESIKNQLTNEAFGSAFVIWLLLGLVVYAVKTIFFPKRY